MYPIRHSAIEPVIRNMWLEIHERHVEALCDSDPLVVFAGDSLTDGWQHQPSWQAQLSKYRPVNLGIGGDRTQHLLWRLMHHQLPSAPLYVLLVGTNNIGKNPPEEIVDGIQACCREIHAQCPESRIVLQHLLPRQKVRSDPYYREVEEVNARLAGLVDGERVVGADFSDVFQVEGEAHLHPERMAEDHVHITPAGYEAWADAMVPELDRMLAES